jgi:plasmid stabilization system protein ParE
VRIRYLAAARDEIQEAADYYSAIAPELARAFRREVRDSVRRVSAMPKAWPESGHGTRKCLLARFPYLIIYIPRSDEVLVLAVGHQHRQPGFWRGRLSGSQREDAK